MWWTGSTETVNLLPLTGKIGPKSKQKKESIPSVPEKNGEPPRTRLYHLWQATGWTGDLSRQYQSSSPFQSIVSDFSTPSPDLAVASYPSQSRCSQASRGESRLSLNTDPPRSQVSQRSHSNPRTSDSRLSNNRCHSAGKSAEDHVRATSSGYSYIAPDQQCMGKSDALAGTEYLSLVDDAMCSLTLKPRCVDRQAMDYAKRFKDQCRHKYRSLVQAWRKLLDPDGIGRVPFVLFATKAKLLGFKDVKRLWIALDINKSGFLTLEEWDPVAFRNLYEFRDICMKEFGGIEVAFNFGLDHSGFHRITFQDLEKFCFDFDFSGDVKVLFHSLDKYAHGYLLVSDLDFLASWEGERFAKVDKLFDFPLARLHQVQAQPKFHAKERLRRHSELQRIISTGKRASLKKVVPGLVACG